VAKQKVYAISPESTGQLLTDILEQLNVADGDQVAVFSYGSRLVLERAVLRSGESSAPQENFVLRVESCLATRLATQKDLSARDVARDLDISVTTLHRFLRGEGVTFFMVLDGLRCRIALQLFAQSAKKPTSKQLMSRLGYMDRSACFKALRRWGV